MKSMSPKSRMDGCWFLYEQKLGESDRSQIGSNKLTRYQTNLGSNESTQHQSNHRSNRRTNAKKGREVTSPKGR